jgi:hypothetical protein
MCRIAPHRHKQPVAARTVAFNRPRFAQLQPQIYSLSFNREAYADLYGQT